MKKSTKRILIFIAVFLTLGILYAALILPLNGSLIYKLLITEEVRRYVSDTYGDAYTVERAVYNFKMDTYLCHVHADTGLDENFDVYKGKNNILRDDYAQRVTNKDNTIWRLARELDARMEYDFVPAYAWDCVNAVLRFDQETIDRGAPETLEKFYMDMPLDMAAPPVPLDMTLWVLHEAPSWEALAQSLQEAVKTVDALGWQVDHFSVSLYLLPDGSSEKFTDGTTDYCAFKLPRAVIEAEGLAAYLEENAPDLD